MSTKRKFTPWKIKNLKANPYTLRVKEDTISYWTGPVKTDNRQNTP